MRRHALPRPSSPAGALSRVPCVSDARRCFIHQLSEIPLSEVFTTKSGNPIQREDQKTVKLAGTIAMEVGKDPPLVPTAQLTSQIPTSAFSGPVEQRDEKVLMLLEKGKDANAAGDFKMACACFEVRAAPHYPRAPTGLHTHATRTAVPRPSSFGA